MNRLLEWINSHPYVHIDFHQGALYLWIDITFDTELKYDVNNKLFDKRIVSKTICIEGTLDEDKFFNMLDNMYDSIKQ